MSDTIAEVRSWNDLHAALRARAESLNVSRLVLDELSGLQSGYASKLLAPGPIRHFGRVSLGAMLGALGLKLVVQEDKEALARVAGRLVRRERNVRRRGQDARPSNVRFWPKADTNPEKLRPNLRGFFKNLVIVSRSAKPGGRSYLGW
jgi:hypothetical protein